MANKGPRIKVMLVPEKGVVNRNGRPTGTAYYTYRNTRNGEKLVLIKFDPEAYDPKTGKKGFRVKFVEKKIPK